MEAVAEKKMFDVEKWMRVDSYGHTPESAKIALDANIRFDTDNRAWVKHVEYNYNNNEATLLSEYIGKWTGEKVVVVGAGRTARTNIKSIIRAQGLGWKIVAVDRIHSFLKGRGVTPDMTMVMDAGKHVKEFLCNLDENDNVGLCLKTHPNTVQACKNRAAKIHFFVVVNPFSPLSIYLGRRLPRDLLCTRAGYTVGFSSFDFAIWSGAATIAMVGLDFGWEKYNQIESYYKDVVIKINIPKRPGFKKKQIFSIETFAKSQKTFVTFMNLHPDIEYIDCSLGVLPIKHCKLEGLL